MVAHGLIGLLPLESLEPPESASAAPTPPAITKPPSRTGGEINVEDCSAALGVVGVPASPVVGACRDSHGETVRTSTVRAPSMRCVQPFSYAKYAVAPAGTLIFVPGGT